jgi:hypothetical protein
MLVYRLLYRDGWVAMVGTLADCQAVARDIDHVEGLRLECRWPSDPPDAWRASSVDPLDRRRGRSSLS